jgi:methyl-accepting chemotaxis protein
MVSLIPLGVFAWLSFQQSQERNQQETRALLSQTADGLGSQVNEWLDKNIRVLKAVAKMPDIVSMDPLMQERILKDLAAEYPWMYLVFTLNPDGLNVARNDDNPLKDYSDRQYYKDVLQGQDLAWQTLIGKTSKKPALVLAVPINYGDRFFGVLAAAMTIDEISKQVATWKKGKTGFAFLVDEAGKVVAHPDKTFVTQQKNLKAHPLVALYRKNKSDATLEFTGDDGNASIGRVKGIDYGWALAIQQDKGEVLADLLRGRKFALYLFAATAVFVILIAWAAARAVVTPIKKLTDVAERMSLGDLKAEIDVKSNDEVGLLAQAIGRMQLSLRMAMERLRARR